MAGRGCKICQKTNSNSGAECVQSRKRRSLLGAKGLFGNMDYFDEDFTGMLGGRKERKAQEMDGYQIYGAPTAHFCQIIIYRDKYTLDFVVTETAE